MAGEVWLTGGMEMTVGDIQAKAKRQGEGGLDARTIALDLECTLGRPLEPDEAQALQDGWRASAPARRRREQERDRAAAVEASRRRG